MTNRTLTQAGALRPQTADGQSPRYTLRYKLAWRWSAFRCWARYALIGRYRGLPGLADFLIGNYLFNAFQVPSELVALGEILVELRPRTALEIGTARGGTLFFLTRLAVPRATIVSVDLEGGKFGGGYPPRRQRFYRRLARRGQRLCLLQGDSHSSEMLERVKAALEGQLLDYLFIDGDHTYEGVQKDFEMYAPLVRRGGIIALHDVVEHPPASGSEVSAFWLKIKSHYRSKELIENPTQGWAGIGILYVD